MVFWILIGVTYALSQLLGGSYLSLSCWYLNIHTENENSKSEYNKPINLWLYNNQRNAQVFLM
jgi:hypothetical protein